MNRLSFLRSTYVMFCVSVHFCPEKSFILFNCVRKLEILISFVLNVSSMLNNLWDLESIKEVIWYFTGVEVLILTEKKFFLLARPSGINVS